MNAAAATLPIHSPLELREPEPKSLTLLELVGSVCDVTDNDDEVVATVLHLLRSGRIRLCGNFRGSSIDELA